MIFIFQGSYSFGITPTTLVYPSEILNYSIRANGMAAWALVVNLCGYVLPIDMTACLVRWLLRFLCTGTQT
jgi:hypothetical protein